jgi:hypothetical protein
MDADVPKTFPCPDCGREMKRRKCRPRTVSYQCRRCRTVVVIPRKKLPECVAAANELRRQLAESDPERN